jgi:hypothetical protein
MVGRTLGLTLVVVFLLASCVTYSDKDRLRTRDFSDFEAWSKVSEVPLTGDGGGFLAGKHLEERGMREVYTNEIGRPVFQEGGPVPFPSGTIIVKDTFYLDDGGAKGRRWNITVMRKRDAGYDPDHNDWEYVTAGPRKGVRYQGTMELCIDCHIAAERDYVFTWR